MPSDYSKATFFLFMLRTFTKVASSRRNVKKKPKETLQFRGKLYRFDSLCLFQEGGDNTENYPGRVPGSYGDQEGVSVICFVGVCMCLCVLCTPAKVVSMCKSRGPITTQISCLSFFHILFKFLFRCDMLYCCECIIFFYLIGFILERVIKCYLLCWYALIKLKASV